MTTYSYSVCKKNSTKLEGEFDNGNQNSNDYQDYNYQAARQESLRKGSCLARWIVPFAAAGFKHNAGMYHQVATRGTGGVAHCLEWLTCLSHKHKINL